VSEKINLFGLTLDNLQNLCQEWRMPRFRARQIAEWLYQKRVSSFKEMTNLSLQDREFLEEKTCIEISHPLEVQESQDGTRKYLFRGGKTGKVEAAYIPEEKRNTLCVSTQVGCKMGCLFCMTARQGFQGQVTAAQILNQIRSLPESESLTHLVFMGMGEPLDNLGHLLPALEILTADWGFGFSHQKITVSSIGLLPALGEFLDKSPCRFALSLHSPFDDQRKQLMPIETVHPLREILDYLRNREDAGKRRISMEYIVFKGINDSLEHARELSRILQGLKTRVNLIPFHPIPGSPLKGADPRGMEQFRDWLLEKGVRTTIRRSRGLDIQAACGLLSTGKLQEKEAEDY